jgi:hypothetical protein
VNTHRMKAAITILAIALISTSPASGDLVTSGLILNFQADNIDGANNSTLTPDQEISTWVDAPAGGANLTAHNATFAGAVAFGALPTQGMPSYVAGLAPSVKFTKTSSGSTLPGAGDALGFDGGIGIGNGAQAFTAFVVGDFTFTGIARIMQFGGKEPGVADRRIIGLADNGFRFNGGTHLFTNSLTNAPPGAHIASYAMAATDTLTDSRYRLDGVDGTHASSTNPTMTINMANQGFIMGIGLDGSGGNTDILDGNVQAILLYNRLLTSQEILDVESFLTAKFIAIPEVGASALVGMAAAISGLWRWNRSKKRVPVA